MSEVESDFYGVNGNQSRGRNGECDPEPAGRYRAALIGCRRAFSDDRRGFGSRGSVDSEYRGVDCVRCRPRNGTRIGGGRNRIRLCLPQGSAKLDVHDRRAGLPTPRRMPSCPTYTAPRAAAYARAARREVRRRSGARNLVSQSRQRNFRLFVRKIMIRSNPVGCLIER